MHPLGSFVAGTRTVCIAGLVSLALSPAPALAVVEITMCGQPELQGRGIVDGKAILMNDLVGCGVRLERSSLDLNGFSITTSAVPVFCETSCKVFGPGTLDAGAGWAVSVQQNSNETIGITRAIVSDVTITGAGCGISANSFSLFHDQRVKASGGVRVSNSVITSTGCAGDAIRASRKAVIKNTVVTGSSEAAVGAGSGHPYSRSPRTVTVKDSQLSTNGLYGITAGRVKITDSTVTGGSLYGVLAGKAVLRGASVSGSADDPICGVTETCADIGAGRARVNSDSSCETSYQNGSGFPGDDLDICSLD